MKEKLLAGFTLASVLANGLLGANVNVSGQITANTTWTADNTYLLNGYVFVTNDATLTIEPGTVVKGKVSSGAGAAALVITRGAKIMAEGTASDPIIFTSELDNLDGNLGPEDTELWGGLVVLGNATINSRANGEVVGTPVQDQIEGFSVSPNETGLITFGGTNDDDNSGVLRYLSIRHGGAEIGTANEINGLTMGGVGRGTTVEYVEVFANKDDGFEWFGGTVNARYLVSAFNNDEAFDYDTGWRGKGQFWFAIQTDIGSERGDKGGEWDGATSPFNATPMGGATVYNATFVGIGSAGGANRAFSLNDNVAAKLYNSVITDYATMIEVDVDLTPERLTAGDIDFRNNLWWSHVAANNNAAAFDAGTTNAEVLWTDAARDNQIADPMLLGISRTTNGGLDPRPAAGSPALTGTFRELPAGDTFYTAAQYKGAFNTTNWAAGWTKLYSDGYFDTTATEDDEVPAKIPNSVGKPVNLSTRGFVGAGDQAMIGGFVIGGTQTQQVIVRASGPGLAAVAPNLAGQVLPDPTLELTTAAGALIKSNDNHAEAAATVSASVGAFALPAGSADAVLVANLAPGNYTAIVRGKNGSSGIVLLEIYEVD